MKHTIRPTRSFCFLLSLVLLTGAGVAAAQDVDGHWEGEIRTPGQALAIDIDLVTGDDGALAGDISIPAQGAHDLPLAELSLDGSGVRFKITGIPGDPTFDGVLSDDGGTIEGSFTQAGQTLPFELKRGAGKADRARAALEDFDEVLERAVADFNLPGLAIAVVAGGEIVYAQGAGYRDLERQLPMTPDSLFAIGSTTKAMTATVLGTLVDEGKLDWDEPLRSYLPTFRLSDSSISERITPRDLVTHRSGLPRHDLVWYNNNTSSRAELIERMAHLELTADLRAEFQYNNLMFMTAGFLAGRLHGGSWEEAMRARLFEPLGMERSNFSVDTSQEDADHALPYSENDDEELERIPFRDIGKIGPAGSVNSSVREMTRWLMLNLRGGQVDEQPLVRSTTLAEIQAPQMTTGSTQSRPDISAAVYGMGWSINTYRGHRQIGHGGGIDGFVTSVVFYPDDDLGLVAFDNRGSGMASMVSRHAADLLLGLEPEDWLGEALEQRVKGREAMEEAEEKAEALRTEGTRPSHALADYAGDYEHPGYGRMRVSLAEETLRLEYNDIEAPLEHWHYDVWNGAETEEDPTFEEQKVQFRANVDGLIAEVVSSLEPRAEPIVFRKQPDVRLSDPDYLQRFVGRYLSATDVELSFELSGNRLQLILPGQAVQELEPQLGGRFVLADASQIRIGFEQDEAGNVVKAIFYQPNGVFDATPIED